MAYKTVSVGVKLPSPVVERLDAYSALREYPSRSAAILRAVEFFLSSYTPRRIRPPTERSVELEKELRRLLRRVDAEKSIGGRI